MTTDSNPHSGIVRVRKDARYFAASNEPFNDTNLSFGARGIMGYLLSKPDGWEVRNQDLYNQSPAGRTAIDRMLKELKDNGYLKRYQARDDKGHLFWVTEVYESKSLNPDYDPDKKNKRTERTKPDSRKTRQPENPTAGKPSDIVSTELLSTETTLKEGASATPAETQPIKEPKKPQTKKPAAVHVYQQEAHRYPAKSWWCKLDEAVGDNPENVKFFGRVVSAWVGSGWNPLNVKGMLEFYARREIPGTKGNGNAAYSTKTNGHQNGIHSTAERQNRSVYFDPSSGQILSTG